MKKTVYALMACAALTFSCAKQKKIQEELTAGEQTYSLTVLADKGDRGTRALGLDGTTLKASWRAGETVTVYKRLAPVGTLTAQTAGTQTTLSGKVTGTFVPGDVLKLEFLSPDYTTQDGTLSGSDTSIDKVCDYATAEITVDTVSGNTITVNQAASFQNQQAIVMFILKNNDKTQDLNAKSLAVTVDGLTITVTPPSARNTLYVAIPDFANKPLSLVASVGDDIYVKETIPTSLQSGKYYSITVTMDQPELIRNEAELRSAVEAEKADIILGNDIPLSRYLDVDGKTVTIDLNGHKIYRSLGSYASDGHVIWAHNGANLILKNGTIQGGKANNGGAIHIPFGNTVTAVDVLFTGNSAADHGGAIWNSGTFSATDCTFSYNAANDVGGLYNANTDAGCGKATLVNCTFTQNSSSNGAGAIGNALGDTELTLENCNIYGNTAGTNGGGIWNGGKLYMQGTVKVQGNLNAAGLAHNVFLKNDTYITFKQSLTTDSNIGLSHEGTTGTCTTGFAAYHSDSGVSPTDFFFADYSTALQLGQTLSGDVCLVYRGDPSNNIKYVVRSWDNGSVVATPASTGQYTLISDATEIVTENGTYVVQGNVTLSHPIRVRANINIVLCDGSSLTVPGILLELNGITLSIFGQVNDSGRIISTGSSGNTGIGTVDKSDCVIRIHGGTIDARGDEYAAGIGTGLHSSDWGVLSRIDIFGGNINAVGGKDAAGIGGGGNNDKTVCRDINIYGGTITAQGGDGDGGAGIGGGSENPGGTVHIYGGRITATGGEEAAGIGCGQDANKEKGAGTIIIDGGTVVARGGDHAAGIGGGDSVPGYVITINGGHVEAYAGVDGAGIGGGEGYGGGTITINGGYVYAEGKDWGTGIGAGEDGDGATVTINGGIVEAVAGSDAASRGCAFGSEDGEDRKGDIIFANKMSVIAGNTKSTATRFSAGERKAACWYRPYARVEVCTHPGYDSTTCPYCSH